MTFISFYMRFFKKQDHELTMMVLRFAIGAVFLWFGIDKMIHPEAWYGWVPVWFMPFIGGRLDQFMFLNGIIEFVLGIMFVSGKALRAASVAAGGFTVAITMTVGVSEVTVRDTALVGACLALFLHANAKSAKRVPEPVISSVCSLYVIYLFIYGLLYLRAGV